MATKDFVTYTPNTGSGDATVSVTAPINLSIERTTNLTISGNEISKVISINQISDVIPLGYSLTYKNETLNYYSFIGGNTPLPNMYFSEIYNGVIGSNFASSFIFDRNLEPDFVTPLELVIWQQKPGMSLLKILSITFGNSGNMVLNLPTFSRFSGIVNRLSATSYRINFNIRSLTVEDEADYYIGFIYDTSKITGMVFKIQLQG